MSDKDKRTGWLRELKEGDLVVVVVPNWGAARYVICRIDKITPTGRLNIGGRTFDHRGDEMIDSSYSKRHLRQVTPQIEEEIKRRNLVTTITECKFEQLNTYTLETICEAIKTDERGNTTNE